MLFSAAPMDAALAALAAFFAYAIGYRIYSRHLAGRVFSLDAGRPTPAHTQRDGVDYLPTRPIVLFGHHFASITGLAPMLGPAVAVIWGWLPALLWVVFGSLLIGCVHDFSAMVVSLRARGMSIGKVAEGIVGRRAKTLFHLIILFGISLAMGVFVFVIARLFSLQLAPGHDGYPQAVLPSGGLMIVAATIGILTYRLGWRLAPLAAAGFVTQLLLVWVGMSLPTLGLPAEAWPSPATWTLILLGYAFLASVLPVWSLLQPRDFLNAFLLFLGLSLSYLGFFVATPGFQAPAVRMSPEGAPPLLPFVFIIIACGATSGFHALVSSGTTAKQLDRETHARPIGYGGMIGESLLGLLAVLACTCGFPNASTWAAHYGSWASAEGLAAKLDAFISGTAQFLTTIGLPYELAASFMAVVVVSFALTTLDSATRLLRFNLEEIGESLGLGFFRSRSLSSLVAVALIGGFAFYEVGGKPAALALWALFGTTNQLLAGLTLLAVTLYLRQRGRPIVYTGIPMLFMLGSTLVAMIENLEEFLAGGQTLLLVVGASLLALALWLIVEGLLAWRRREVRQGLEVF